MKTPESITVGGIVYKHVPHRGATFITNDENAPRIMRSVAFCLEDRAAPAPPLWVCAGTAQETKYLRGTGATPVAALVAALAVLKARYDEIQREAHELAGEADRTNNVLMTVAEVLTREEESPAVIRVGNIEFKFVSRTQAGDARYYAFVGGHDTWLWKRPDAAVVRWWEINFDGTSAAGASPELAMREMCAGIMALAKEAGFDAPPRKASEP
jgi:hypothetical protein